MNTSQSTSNDPFGDYRAETAAIEVTVAILISLSATFGNSLVVYVINKVSRLRNDTNLFILNLALTDIAMGTIYMPFQIANLCTGVWVKVSKVCFTVACFYVITWCPVSIVAGTGISRFAIGQKFSKVSVYLMLSGSVVNPFIYGFMNPQFKQAFKRTLSCGCYGNENTDQSHSRNKVR